MGLAPTSTILTSIATSRISARPGGCSSEGSITIRHLPVQGYSLPGAPRRSFRQIAEAGHLVAMSLDHSIDLRLAQHRAPLAGLAGAEEALGDVGLLAEAAPLLLL